MAKGPQLRRIGGRLTCYQQRPAHPSCSEQVPDFGYAFGPPPLQKNAKICRVGRSCLHRVAVRQIDPADPAFDSAATKTELAGNLPDGTASFKQSPDLIEEFLPGCLAFVAHETYQRDSVRSAIRLRRNGCRCVSIRRQHQSLRRRSSPGPTRTEASSCANASSLSFGEGSERRSARELVELSEKGGVKL
jgi:hypothetical protein